jgi:hypothetical protein
MFHTLLCRLWIHLWGGWYEILNDDHVIVYERKCLCCQERERYVSDKHEYFMNR